MVEDTPDWRVYTNLLECLYHSSAARVAIAGTVESIAEITPETLYACHKAFYDPANMMLCVVGDVKPEDVKAKYESGVLTVLIPKEEPKKLTSSSKIAIE